MALLIELRFPLNISPESTSLLQAADVELSGCRTIVNLPGGCATVVVNLVAILLGGALVAVSVGMKMSGGGFVVAVMIGGVGAGACVGAGVGSGGSEGRAVTTLDNIFWTWGKISDATFACPCSL